MFLKKLSIAIISTLITFNAYAEGSDNHQKIPEPASWSFPDIIQSARAISPHNSEGRKFNEYGLAYSRNELQSLTVLTMSVQDLQKYADIVTHAYPDAIFRMAPVSCKNMPMKNMNETSLANMAYVSLHAIVSSTRERAATCLSEVQNLMRQN